MPSTSAPVSIKPTTPTPTPTTHGTLPRYTNDNGHGHGGGHGGGHGARSPAFASTTTTPDMNRPLPAPPVPTSSVDSYEIPALRRKPIPNQSPSPQQHHRSFSHPFPSFFGTKKSDKKHALRNPAKGQTHGIEDHDDWGHTSSNLKPLTSTPASTHGHPKPAKVDKQPVTGRCMTCDSTVRWPQGLKVFRCTTCLTINDLEPYLDNRPEEPSIGPPPRKPLPLSLDRTRSIISHCLSQYLESHLELNRPPPITPEKTAIGRDSSDGIFPQTFYEEESPPPTPRPVFKIRSTSDPALTPLRSRRGDAENILSTDHPMPIHQPTRPTSSRNPPGSLDDAARPGAPPKTAPHVFALLENYIAASFTGSASLNASFFTVKPVEPSNSAPSQKLSRKQTPETTVPSAESDVFLSQMDAKTLLLGDFAENGSWWTGGRHPKENGDAPLREKSPDRWTGIVTAKSPRINWAELGEWYRLVINAGESWRRRWQDLRNGVPDEKELIWKTVALDRLHHDIIESQIHLQRSLLKSTENLLKRTRRPLKHPEDCRFLLMLSFNPLLYSPSTPLPSPPAPPPTSGASSSRPPGEPSHPSPPKRAISGPRRQGSLGHHSGIVKRILGLLANLPNEVHQFLISWFSRFPDPHFQKVVDLVGGFVTYRLSRQQRRPAAELINPTAGLVPSFSDTGIRHPSQLHAALDIRSSSTSTKASDGKPRLASYGEDWQVRAAARVMSLLFQANIGHSARKRDLPGSLEQRMLNAGLNAKYQANAHGQILPVSSFYNSMLDYADLVADFEAWESTKTKFTFCQYPFFLSIYAKIHILEHDARRQMEDKAREAFFDSILSRKAVSQYLVLKVRRDCLVEDSLRNVSEVVGAAAGEIKKGLRIDFTGEEGIDAGGLRKEWFLLLTREIFDPNHGLFVYDEESQYCYFNPYCFESSEQFFLVGVLLGLAIYNSTILDVAFPPFVFKKMLASAPSMGEKLISTPRIAHGYTLEDLAEFRPTLAKGLRQLLEFEGDVEETFCRDFVAEMDRYGEIIQVPLCPGGEKRAVTNSNRKDFVDLYVHYLLDGAVARQYEPFKRGFFTVCGGNALSLFRPEEIELLVRGSEEPLDITSLRAVATYDGWPKDRGPPDKQAQVGWFWDFFQRVSPGDQRKILSFVTGSDRIPAMGATNLVIKIQCLKAKKEDMDKDGVDVGRFPTARTCFNTISLYQYATRGRLEEKLWMAVEGSEGFGLK